MAPLIILLPPALCSEKPSLSVFLLCVIGTNSAFFWLTGNSNSDIDGLLKIVSILRPVTLHPPHLTTGEKGL
jgi:hypothetical protein